MENNGCYAKKSQLVKNLTTTLQIRNLVENKIFTARFIKKDGTIREMNCRLGVKKHLKGGELNHSPEALNHLIVFDMKTEAYRIININTLLKIKVSGITYDLVENELRESI